MSNTELPDQNPSDARHLSTTLCEVLGQQLNVVPHDPLFQRACRDETCHADCACSLGIFVDELSQYAWSLTIRNIAVNGRRFDAHGVVQSLDRASLIRSAKAVRQLIEQSTAVSELNEQLNCFAEQASGDLEEACWFRTMADQVAACRPNDPFVQLCDRMLPKLRSLLHARSVLVIRDSAAGEAELVALESELSDFESVEQCCLQLVRRYGTNVGEPFVRNVDFLLRPDEDPKIYDGASGVILVRIGAAEHQFGWLVAVDRCDAVGTPAQSRRGETEFGTHEATLMETAAVLLATHAANCELFEEQEQTLVGVVTAMVNALDARDPYTRGHSHRVALISQRLGQELGLDAAECENIHLSGLLHDIGKIGVPDQVLLKDGALNLKERLQIEQHTVIGNSILEPVAKLSHILPGVLHHHERVDGGGYPARLAGDNIPLVGRILAVADAYDAMTTSRPYRSAMPTGQAEAILLEGAGSHWDERVLDAFFSVLDDVRRIYDRDEHHESNQRQSLLQYARFEDASQGTLSERLQSTSYGAE